MKNQETSNLGGETPDEIRDRLQREEYDRQRIKEMESIPDYKRVNGKLEKVSVEEKRKEAIHMAKEQAEIDRTKKELNKMYEEHVEIIIPSRASGKKAELIKKKVKKAA